MVDPMGFTVLVTAAMCLVIGGVFLSIGRGEEAVRSYFMAKIAYWLSALFFAFAIGLFAAYGWHHHFGGSGETEDPDPVENGEVEYEPSDPSFADLYSDPKAPGW